MAFPKITAQNPLYDIFKSKTPFKNIRKYPQWDVARNEPRMNLVAARRLLHESELRLVDKRDESRRKREALDAQWSELERDAAKFKNNFIEFDKMVTENLQKRERASKKTQKEIQSQQDRDVHIKEMQINIDTLEEIRDKMEIQIKNHQIYEDYLQTIVDAHPEYKSPMDLYNKFGALEEARNAVTKRLDANLTALENTKTKILKSNVSQSSALIGVNNRIADLHHRYTVAKSNADKWENIIKKIQDRAKDKLVEILEVRKACWDTYSNMSAENREEIKFPREDFEKHLWYISKTMTQLKRTIEIAEKMGTKITDSVRAESSKSKNSLRNK